MKEFFALLILIAGLAGGITLLVVKSIDGNEIHECRKWQEMAAQYQGFYLVQWQADQCSYHNIIINAPVK